MATADTPHVALDSHVTSLETNEVQKVTLTPMTSGKTWTLTFDGETTSAIAAKASATAAEVTTKLEGLSNIGSGDVSVTGSTGGPFEITFTGDYAGVNVPLLTGAAAEGEPPTIALVTAGGPNADAVRRGTGLADREEETSPLTGKTPAEHRSENASTYGD